MSDDTLGVPGTTTEPARGPAAGTAAEASSTSSQRPAVGPTLARASAVMATGTAVSRVLGFARTVVLLAVLQATGVVADAFDIANKVPNILYILLAGGVLNAVLVPAIVRASARADGGKDFLDRLLTLCFTLLGVSTVLMTLAAPWLVRLYASDQAPAAQVNLATAFAYWCVPQLFFYGMYAVLGQVLNARERFGGYMWAPALNNVVGIVALVAFLVAFGAVDPGEGVAGEASRWTPLQVAVLAGGATLGVVAQGVVLWFPLRASGYRYRPRLGVRGVGLGAARRVAMWTFAAVVVAQLGLVVTTRVANGAAAQALGTPEAAQTPGNLAYSTAYLLFMLPHSLVAVSLVTALFTRLAAAARTDDTETVRRDLTRGLRAVGVLVVPAAVALVVLARPVAMAMTGSTDDAAAVGSVAAAMAVGLPAFSATYLVQRVFYAYEDARTPFLVSVPATLVVVTVDLLSAALLPPRWVVVGVGAGMSLAAVVSVTSAVVLLRRRIGPIGGAPVTRTYVRVLLAGLVAGGVAALVTAGASALVGLDGTQDGAHVRLVGLALCATGGAVLLALYAGGLRLMRVEELATVTGMLRRRLRR